MTESIEWEFSPKTSRLHRAVSYIMLGSLGAVGLFQTALVLWFVFRNVPRKLSLTTILIALGAGLIVIFTLYYRKELSSIVANSWPVRDYSFSMLFIASVISASIFLAVASISFDLALGLLTAAFISSALFENVFSSSGKIDFERGRIDVENQSADFGDIEAVRTVNMGLFTVVRLSPRNMNGSPFPHLFAVRSETAARIESELHRALR